MIGFLFLFAVVDLVLNCNFQSDLVLRIKTTDLHNLKLKKKEEKQGQEKHI